jgi:hypothetical protein
MKTIKLIIIFFAAMCVCPTYARRKHVLPPPVISEQPTKIRFVLKNAPKEHELQILLHTTEEMYEDIRLVQSDKKSKNVQTCEQTFTPGMSKMVHFQIQVLGSDNQSRQFDLKADYNVFLVAVPGKDVQCTIDLQTGGISIKTNDGFERLDKEINDLYAKGYLWAPQHLFLPEVPDSLAKQNLTLLDLYKDVPPSVMVDSVLNKYHEVDKKLWKEVKGSDETKELWRCNIEIGLLSAFYTYWSEYYERHPEHPGKDTDSDYIAHVLSPLSGNAYFYTLHISTVSSLIYFSDNKIEISPTIRRFNRAIEQRNMIRSHYTLSKKQLDYLRTELPEYYEPLRKYNDSMEQYLDSMRHIPPRGKFCKLDKTLEGDSILTALINRYKGKPTIIRISLWPSFLLWDIKATLWEIYKDLSDYRELFNYVTLCGGEYADEKQWKEWVRNYEGDHYYLMKYQADWLFKQYSIDGQIHGSSVLGIAADGTVHIFNDDKPGHPLEAVNWLLSQLGVK